MLQVSSTSWWRRARDAWGLVPGVVLRVVGRIRGAVSALLTARKLGLQTWLGCMVGSNLNCTATAQLMSLAPLGDVDGPLLVDDKGVFSGGLQWAMASRSAGEADGAGAGKAGGASAAPHGSVSVPDCGEGVPSGAEASCGHGLGVGVHVW